MATVRHKQKPKASANAVPKAYSYLRFSTPEQALGNSEKRQLDWAKAVAAGRGLTLDESMADRGIPASDGSNLRKGHLGRFLDRIQTGEVVAGSILIVEYINRLSRQTPIKAIETIISGIIGQGVGIVTRDDFYDVESVNNGKVQELIAEIYRAYRESKNKSVWLTAAWDEKRKGVYNGVPLSRKCPEWLVPITPDPAKKKHFHFEVLPEARTAIRKIFELKAKKLFNSQAITDYMIDHATWAPKRKKKRLGKEGETVEGWNPGYVKKVLADRSVLGEFQPHSWKMIDGQRKHVPVGEPIKDYYPQIIVVGVFERVQEILALTKGTKKGGRRGTSPNIFKHIAKCAYCGGPMRWTNDRPGKNEYLFCVNDREKHSCPKTPSTIRYDECVKTVLHQLSKLDPNKILPADNEQQERCQELSEEIRELTAELNAIETETTNLVSHAKRTASAKVAERYEREIDALEARKPEREQQKIAKEAELDRAQRTAASFKAWQKNIATVEKELAEKQEVRERLKSLLLEQIDRIEIFMHGHNYPHSKDEFRDYWNHMNKHLSKAGELKLSRSQFKIHEDFCRWAMEQRATKKGRFLRVYFRGARPNAAYWDLIPEGSVGGEPWYDGSGSLEAEFQLLTGRQLPAG